MNTKELVSIFEKNRIPAYFYTIGGLGAGDCYGVEQSGDGWLLYYSERGSKFPREIYKTEDEACRALLGKVSEQSIDELNRKIQL